jgi:sugar lactone lactonase YvrE
VTRTPPVLSTTAALMLLLAWGALPRSASAVSPVMWTVETLDEFEQGKPDGIAVGAPGELTLSPALIGLNVPALEQSSEPFLWSVAVDSKGTVYAGGGRNGTVYRIPKGGTGAAYYETGELAVRALVLDKSDTLFAATLPEGRIVRITGEGKGETWYQPEDRYIWDLATGPKGELYAATGERGIIYKITGSGKAEVFFDSPEFHIVSLGVDPQGNVIAGSDGKGLLYRITPQGTASVLYDSPLREIAAVAIDPKGSIYATALGSETEAPPLPLLLPQTTTPVGREQVPAGLPGQPPVQVPGIADEPTPRVTVTTVGASFSPGGPPARSEVYRVDPDGTVVTLWSSPGEVAYALAIDAAGRPVIGTGEPGRLRVLTGPQQSTQIARLPSSQVTAIAVAGRELVVAASNVGRLYRLDPAQADTGAYLSAPQDAATVARWGRIGWRAQTPATSKVEISTRTGNSATPDDTWSEWSPPYASSEGSAIASPAGRYLQWRARLERKPGSDGPTLSAVSVTYVQANLPPILRHLTVLPPGVVRERSGGSPEVDPESLAFTGIRAQASSDRSDTSPGKKIYVRGMRALEWESEDPNGDTLAYDLWFRGDGETAWKPLQRGLREPAFSFDSMSLPDGLYRIRVDATDAPSNPGEQARTATLITEAFLVDNTPPVVQVAVRKGAKGSVTLEVNASDGIGPVARADVSMDAARFTPLAAADGASDSRAETYTQAFEGLRAGEHTVIVRVTDLLGNTGSGKATFTSE